MAEPFNQRELLSILTPHLTGPGPVGCNCRLLSRVSRDVLQVAVYKHYVLEISLSDTVIWPYGCTVINDKNRKLNVKI